MLDDTGFANVTNSQLPIRMPQCRANTRVRIYKGNNGTGGVILLIPNGDYYQTNLISMVPTQNNLANGADALITTSGNGWKYIEIYKSIEIYEISGSKYAKNRWIIMVIA